MNRLIYGKLGMSDEERRRALQEDINLTQKRLEGVKDKTCSSAIYLERKIQMLQEIQKLK